MIFTLGVIASSIKAVGVATPPVPSDVRLLRNFDLPNDILKDENGHTFANNGTQWRGGTVEAVAKTDGSGGYYAYFNGFPATVTPMSPDLAIWSKALAMEMMVGSYYGSVVESAFDQSTNAGWYVDIDSNRYSQFFTGGIFYTSTVAISSNPAVFTKVKFEYDGLKLEIFVNDVVALSTVVTLTISDAVSYFVIGGFYTIGTGERLGGNIDLFKLSVGS